MNERIREIALRFFEGTITAEEECELYGFLNGNPQGLAQMREWESCWKRDHVPPADVLDSLDSLRRRGRRTPSDPAGFTPASVGVRSRPFIFFRSRSAAAAACRIGLALRESRPVSGRKFHSFFRGGEVLTADFSPELLIPKGFR